MSEDLVDKRNFFLMLSVIEGQRLAHAAGFSVPSEEVQQNELLDVIKKWLILSASGILDDIKNCVGWAIETNDEFESEEDLDMILNALTSFGVGLVSHLLDTQALVLSSTLESSEESAALFLQDLFSDVLKDIDDE